MSKRRLSTEADSNSRIAFFLATPWGDGAERVVVTLVNAIADRGLEVDLVLYRAGSYRGRVSEKVRIVDLGSSGAMMSIPGLVRYLTTVRPGSMLSTIEQANIALLLAKRLSRVPVRVVVREANTTSRSLGAAAGIRGRLHRRLAPVCYPWADAVIAVSEGVADDLSSSVRVARDGIKVVYNPVALAELRAMASAPIYHNWFMPGQPPVIVGSGRLSPQKDFATLIRAFAKLRAHREARLLILGEGAERENLESLAGELGVHEDVSMPGHLDNPYAYVARASVFALSSCFEGLPNALIEALALGVPVVSTDCESGPREILEEGRYGKLVPVADPDAMCRAMVEALNQGKTSGVHAEVLARFDLRNAVDNYLRIMTENAGAGVHNGQ